MMALDCSAISNTWASLCPLALSAPSLITIGDSIVMVSSGGGVRTPMPSFLHVYVDDVDATYERAIQAGAMSIEAPAEMPYGDRRAMVKDPCGNDWRIATHRVMPRR